MAVIKLHACIALFATLGAVAIRPEEPASLVQTRFDADSSLGANVSQQDLSRSFGLDLSSSSGGHDEFVHVLDTIDMTHHNGTVVAMDVYEQGRKAVAYKKSCEKTLWSGGVAFKFGIAPTIKSGSTVNAHKGGRKCGFFSCRDYYVMDMDILFDLTLSLSVESAGTLKYELPVTVYTDGVFAVEIVIGVSLTFEGKKGVSWTMPGRIRYVNNDVGYSTGSASGTDLDFSKVKFKVDDAAVTVKFEAFFGVQLAAFDVLSVAALAKGGLELSASQGAGATAAVKFTLEGEAALSVPWWLAWGSLPPTTICQATGKPESPTSNLGGSLAMSFTVPGFPKTLASLQLDSPWISHNDKVHIRGKYASYARYLDTCTSATCSPDTAYGVSTSDSPHETTSVWQVDRIVGAGYLKHGDYIYLKNVYGSGTWLDTCGSAAHTPGHVGTSYQSVYTSYKKIRHSTTGKWQVLRVNGQAGIISLSDEVYLRNMYGAANYLDVVGSSTCRGAGNQVVTNRQPSRAGGTGIWKFDLAD